MSFDVLEQLYFITKENGWLIAWLELLTVSQNHNERMKLWRLKTLHINMEAIDISRAEAFRVFRQLLLSRCKENEGYTQLGLIILQTSQTRFRLEPDQMEVIAGFVAGGLVVVLNPKDRNEAQGEIKTLFGSTTDYIV
jgi:hypothetical protein